MNDKWVLICEVADEIYVSIREAMKDLTLFPGRHLRYPLYFSAGLTSISLICWLFKIPAFVDWKGSLLGTLILSILYYFGERRGNNASAEVPSVIDRCVQTNETEFERTGAIKETGRFKDYNDIRDKSNEW